MMRKSIFGGVLVAILLTGCGNGASVEQKETLSIDQTDPKAVMQAVFDVANGAAPATLGGLCDPEGQNDIDTKRICDQANGFDPQGEFAVYFKDGKINGEPKIAGDTATVPFVFGPGTPRADEMVMIRRSGKWYLLRF